MAVPEFVDFHPVKPFTADEPRGLQSAPPNDSGVTHDDAPLL